MARGANKPVGSERISQNGYHYTKTDTGWELTHRVIAERELLGRPLNPNERVTFRNNNRQDLRPENLQVTKINSSLQALYKRREGMIVRLEELQAQIADLDEDIRRRELNGES